MHKPNQVQTKVIDQSLANLLKNTDPALADKLSKMWEQDRVSFLDAVKAATEGKEVTDWAKPSCKHCYGRGYTATAVKTGTKITCRCALKRYSKWMKEFRKEFNQNRGTKNVSEEPSISTETEASGGPEAPQEALISSAEARE